MTVSPGKLKAARELLGWTRDNAGAKLGLHTNTVGRAELRGSAKNELTIMRLAALYEANGVEFIGDEECPGARLRKSKS